MRKRISVIVIAVIMAAVATGCSRERNMELKSGIDNTVEAYFAGGCFWGMEMYMASVPGVKDVTSGYANGSWDKDHAPSYEEVCAGDTGFKETVRVLYDAEAVSYEMLVRAYFLAIDPTVKDMQAGDTGTQYQTGIYYLDDEQKNTALKVADGVKRKVDVFAVEIEPLSVFYEAEEYHQDYLEKNPNGYCHISTEEIEEMKKLFHRPTYEKPEDDELRTQLTELQYNVTQNSYTESPFNNEYWDFFEKGIYVDIVSKEPLFSSEDKYKSSCGWPAFTEDKSGNIQYIEDTSHNMVRTEVRSGVADSHLGHVFTNDPESPNGTRFCINSAALEFIPYDELDERGYGYTKEWFVQ